MPNNLATLTAWDAFQSAPAGEGGRCFVLLMVRRGEPFQSRPPVKAGGAFVGDALLADTTVSIRARR
ncbi:hypothetical protein [Roseateles sp.]|uniref:hypothetical protein n=1 Tax=Roseateles sp. TaxID=1971397 RepID=UPI003964866C